MPPCKTSLVSIRWVFDISFAAISIAVASNKSSPPGSDPAPDDEGRHQVRSWRWQTHQQVHRGVHRHLLLPGQSSTEMLLSYLIILRWRALACSTRSDFPEWSVKETSLNARYISQKWMLESNICYILNSSNCRLLDSSIFSPTHLRQDCWASPDP